MVDDRLDCREMGHRMCRDTYHYTKAKMVSNSLGSSALDSRGSKHAYLRMMGQWVPVLFGTTLKMSQGSIKYHPRMKCWSGIALLLSIIVCGSVHWHNHIITS